MHLLKKLEGKNLPIFNVDSIQKARETMLNHLNQNNDDDSFPMKPQRVLADVRKVMNDDDIVLSDVGAHKMWVARESTIAPHPTHVLYQMVCTMGFALPGSMEQKWFFQTRKFYQLTAMQVF